MNTILINMMKKQNLQFAHHNEHTLNKSENTLAADMNRNIGFKDIIIYENIQHFITETCYQAKKYSNI